MLVDEAVVAESTVDEAAVTAGAVAALVEEPSVPVGIALRVEAETNEATAVELITLMSELTSFSSDQSTVPEVKKTL